MYRIAVLLTAVVLLAGCSSAPETEPEPADTSTEPSLVTPDPASSADGPSGIWTGDWGPSEQDRNNVRLELQWNGTTLTGTINPGDGAVPLTSATYDPATMMVMMEADATGRGGAKVHYVIEGKVEGTSMTGTWRHETRKGDFKLTRS